jgi:integrase
MTKLTDTMIRGLKPGEKRSESLDAGGSLLIKYRKGKRPIREYYFRDRSNGNDITVKLGTTETLRSLIEARDAGRSMANKSAAVSNLKFQLKEEKRKTKEAEAAAIRERLRLDGLGTLSQLCEVYRDKMKSGDKSSYTKVYAALERYVIKPYPDLASKQANLITADDIKLILKAMYDRGITTTINRTRGDLHAAFNVGLTYDHDITIQRADNLCFDISTNPVAKVKKIKQFERALKRFLNPEELRVVWGSCADHMNPVYASLLKIMICTGYHPAELMRLTVQDIQAADKAIYMTKTKSGMPNLIPLNRFAWSEIQCLIANTDSSGLLFPSRVSNPKGDIYSRVSVLSNQVADMRPHLPIEAFTPRDIRRTVKTLMGKAGITKEMRDRIQNHAVSDVSGKHYDQYEYMPEKRAAMKTWERWLAQHVIEPELEPSKVVSITG